ncbi:hypothetical protein M2145_002519 [Lachnospiraceae bacterium PF1-21]
MNMTLNLVMATHINNKKNCINSTSEEIDLKKNVIFTILIGTLVGCVMSVLTFVIFIYLATTLAFPVWICETIPALICLIMLFFTEKKVLKSPTEGKNRILFYIVCIISFFVGIIVLNYAYLNGMDRIALFRYFIPIGLITFGLRMVIYLIRKWLKKINEYFSVNRDSVV